LFIKTLKANLLPGATIFKLYKERLGIEREEKA